MAMDQKYLLPKRQNIFLVTELDPQVPYFRIRNRHLLYFRKNSIFHWSHIFCYLYFYHGHLKKLSLKMTFNHGYHKVMIRFYSIENWRTIREITVCIVVLLQTFVRVENFVKSVRLSLCKISEFQCEGYHESRKNQLRWRLEEKI